MKVKLMKEEVAIPTGVNVALAGTLISVKGAQGEVKRDFNHPRVRIEQKENKVIFTVADATKRDKTLLGAYKAHLKNMIKGCKNKHRYELKICSGHFPMNVAVAGDQFIVKNFLGEKVPRVMTFNNKEATISVEGTQVFVDSPDKEIAGRVAAAVEKLTLVKGRDRRIFQDGIYIINKAGKEMA